MTTFLRCSGCETGYDVSRREPGKKVRCPRCSTVLVVPEADEVGESVTASSRLRRARGASCDHLASYLAEVPPAPPRCWGWGARSGSTSVW